MYSKQVYHSPIGELSLVASDKGLRGIWFQGQAYFEKGIEVPINSHSHPILEETSRLLDIYFSGQAVSFSSIPLDIQGTVFQKKVWNVLKGIPYGQTTTYGKLAKQLGILSAQAIGGAVGKNPFSILIPCHRVLGAKGQLTGYAGGLEKKIWLLQHEHSNFEVKQ